MRSASCSGTRAQLDELRLDGCTEAQGFYFSRAIPASRIAEFLSGRKSDVA